MTTKANRPIILLRVSDAEPGVIRWDRDEKKLRIGEDAWRLVRTLAARAGSAVPIEDLLPAYSPRAADARHVVSQANEEFRSAGRFTPSIRLVRAAGNNHFFLDVDAREVQYVPLPWDGHHLAQARAALDLTQVEMAAALGLTQTTICTKEADPSTLAASNRDRLAVEALLRRAGRWPLPMLRSEDTDPNQ